MNSPQQKKDEYAEMNALIKERLSGTPKENAIFWSIFMALVLAAYFGGELIKSIAIILLIITLISRSIYYSNKRKEQKKNSAQHPDK
jgi:uncharacterized MAPEG superfamily protein